MQVKRISSFEELQSLSEPWNSLDGNVPFCRSEWLSSWWRHYGEAKELFVLSVFDAQQSLVGLAPWYMESCRARGRILRFLGSGDVCSDYLSVLAAPEHEDAVVAAIADWLTAAVGSRSHEQQDRWDLLELNGVAAADRRVAKLVEHLVEDGCRAHRRPGLNCWRIELPKTWDELAARLSKSHRKQVRRLEQSLLDTGRAVLRSVQSKIELPAALEILVDLHQRRRQSLGEPGCFACRRFKAFIEEAAERLLACGRLQLQWLELDGRPVAAEFMLGSGGVVYLYQAGLDPDMLDQQPGRLINIASMKQAIADAQQAFDFLRGDEPYKRHWRAEPHPTVDLQVVPNQTVSQVRHGVWLAGRAMKHWFTRGLNLTGMR